MFTKTIIAASALLSMAAAVPLQQLNKRPVVWETSTHVEMKTVQVTTTIWLQPGEAAPTDAAAPTDSAAPAAAAAPTKHFGHSHHHKKPKPSPQPQPPAQSPPPSPSAPPAAPTASTPAAPTSTPYTPPQPAPSQPAGGAPSGDSYTGDITHYDVGLGSCGFTNNDSEAVVAIPEGMMNNGANPNANPLCGKTITISYAGQEHTAKIVDTCGGCSGASIDLSPTLFQSVAPSGDGRVHGVKWWYN